ncbi:uncharacterized protein [Spinacia oleracea]|uniref:Uncharacterized protein n=1 Tax=Spinacia oleracea TaxID=3562 RepID=A0A9R0IH20_SPIOL|nr:uncharacterized protein LOC110787654 [Spinacia oleracea]
MVLINVLKPELWNFFENANVSYLDCFDQFIIVGKWMFGILMGPMLFCMMVFKKGYTGSNKQWNFALNEVVKDNPAPEGNTSKCKKFKEPVIEEEIEEEDEEGSYSVDDSEESMYEENDDVAGQRKMKKQTKKNPFSKCRRAYEQEEDEEYEDYQEEEEESEEEEELRVHKVIKKPMSRAEYAKCHGVVVARERANCDRKNNGFPVPETDSDLPLGKVLATAVKYGEKNSTNTNSTIVMSNFVRALQGPLEKHDQYTETREKDSVREKDLSASGCHRASGNAFLDLDGVDKSVNKVLKDLDYVDVRDDDSDDEEGALSPGGREFLQDNTISTGSTLRGTILGTVNPVVEKVQHGEPVEVNLKERGALFLADPVQLHDVDMLEEVPREQEEPEKSHKEHPHQEHTPHQEPPHQEPKKDNVLEKEDPQKATVQEKETKQEKENENDEDQYDEDQDGENRDGDDQGGGN